MQSHFWTPSSGRFARTRSRPEVEPVNALLTERSLRSAAFLAGPSSTRVCFCWCLQHVSLGAGSHSGHQVETSGDPKHCVPSSRLPARGCVASLTPKQRPAMAVSTASPHVSSLLNASKKKKKKSRAPAPPFRVVEMDMDVKQNKKEIIEVSKYRFPKQ